MQEYTVIKKGHAIKHCINIPDEFNEMRLEIKIRPVSPRHDVRRKLESLYNKNKDVDPFRMIQNVEKWQQELRDEWE